MTGPYEFRKLTSQERRTSRSWLSALVILVAIGFVLPMAFAEEAWMKPVVTIIIVLTAFVGIGSLRTSLRIHRDLNRDYENRRHES